MVINILGGEKMGGRDGKTKIVSISSLSGSISEKRIGGTGIK